MFRIRGKLVSCEATVEQLNLPHVLLEIANQPRGLIVVTAPTGSGKSTILAAMINHINMTKPVHILTYRGSCRIYISSGSGSSKTARD